MVTNWVQEQPFAKDAASLMVRVRTQQRTFIQDQPMKKNLYLTLLGTDPFLSGTKTICLYIIVG
jgi:hypothetical protein